MKCVAFIIVFCLAQLYAAWSHEVIKDFQKYSYRAAFFNNEAHKAYKYRMLLIEEGKDDRDVQVIVSSEENAAIIFVKNKLQKLLFLRRADSENEWMISNKARKAIKITASRNVVSNYNVEDLTGADFENDYSIEKLISDEEVLLKSLGRKSAFPYVSLRKIDEKTFLAQYYSHNKKPIKEITYRLGIVDGHTFWYDFSVVDLVYKNVKSVRMQTTEVLPISVPKSLFYTKTMQRFFTIFK